MSLSRSFGNGTVTMEYSSGLVYLYASLALDPFVLKYGAGEVSFTSRLSFPLGVQAFWLTILIFQEKIWLVSKLSVTRRSDLYGLIHGPESAGEIEFKFKVGAYLGSTACPSSSYRDHGHALNAQHSTPLRFGWTSQKLWFSQGTSGMT